ncbi:ATP-binding cassette domain-containing protein [Arcanobacterium hippocoleae]
MFRTSKNASFGYEPKTQVLKDINLTVPTGETVVLLGTSGGGKSTLLSLISGDLVPDSGNIKVAQNELSPTTQDGIRAKSAAVHQQTWLFAGTLAENLRIANPNASPEQMHAALERVALGDWVRSLPQGIDTDLGERGSSVSGGQAQRISIARAILSERELMIFDEPTSQVDLESEAVIEKVLAELASEKLSSLQHTAWRSLPLAHNI